MNPFDLEGPQFLMFFACLGIVVVLANWLAARVRAAAGSARAGGEPASPDLGRHPHGGGCQAVLAAIVLLEARGLLDRVPGCAEPRRYRTRAGVSGLGHDPLERALLEHFEQGGDVGSACARPEVQLASAAWPDAPEEDAIAAPAGWPRRGPLLVTGSLGVLWYVALVRILDVFATGLAAALVLAAAALVFSVATVVVARPRRGAPAG